MTTAKPEGWRKRSAVGLSAGSYEVEKERIAVLSMRCDRIGPSSGRGGTRGRHVAAYRRYKMEWATKIEESLIC